MIVLFVDVERKMSNKALGGAVALTALLFNPAGAQPTQTQLATLAATIAGRLAASCPMAAPDDVTAFSKCASAVRDDHTIPFGDRLLWGADQPQRTIRKKAVTNFHKDVFKLMYLPLFTFSGAWAVSHDDLDGVDVIRVGAMFRNQLPPGEYPYPFWHSADKWADYEAARGINFYIDTDGRVILATRAGQGSEAGRAGYVHRQPPAFDGHWQWIDAAGALEPRASLFTNKYSSDNPFLPQLESTYKAFALELRKGTCIRCHAPNNRSGMDRLVLLQTPVHAAAEIDDVLKEVRSGEMPQNDLGFKKPLDPTLREAILTFGARFHDVVATADRWEAGHRTHDDGSE